MSNGQIRPSSIDGIKRYAKTLKTSQGVPHAKALNLAAAAGGFQNYTHARRLLEGQASSAAQHLAYISVSWRVRETNATGQEILTVHVKAPLAELVKSHHLKAARHFGAFHFAAPDHLSRDLVASSQSEARRDACAAARTLTFMEATGLRPSAGRSRAYPRGDASKAVPGHDHASEWFDPTTKVYVFVDEPYGRATDWISDERLAWADKHGWAIERPSWAGMYNPDGGCELYVAVDKAKGFDLAGPVAALNSLPPPFVEADWDGRSQAIFPPFVSPAAEAAAAVPKPEPKPRAPRGPDATVGYHVVLSRNERRRPAKRMPVEAHADVGRLLKSVIYDCRERKRVYNPLNSIRCDLDDWVQREYPGGAELPSSVFFDLYYHEEASASDRLTGTARTARHLANLEQARQILSQHYPDCAPLRSLFKGIDRAITALSA